MQVTYEYPGFMASWEHRSNNVAGNRDRQMGITFHGSRGTLYVDRSIMRLTPEERSDLPPIEMKRVADPHPLHWANFLDCVRSRQRPNSDIETCCRSSAACILGNLALRTRLAARLGRAEAHDVAAGGSPVIASRVSGSVGPDRLDQSRRFQSSDSFRAARPCAWA